MGAGCGRALCSGRQRLTCQMTGVSKSAYVCDAAPLVPPPEGRVYAQGVGSVRILGLFGGGGLFVGSGGCF